jgi:2-polyprenyl-3-methyl-5-hydroxy-6-metoxy-1,4-benzoquinol methylase
MEPQVDEYTRANLLNWNNRAELHATDETGTYRIAQVLAGRSCLHDLETREIGDIAGKDIVHLQCHIGIDTLSLRHLGASSVTGLDFSQRAILAARDFALRAGVEARFVEASVYDAPEALGQTYDIVFVSWGAIIWLDDIFRWARVVSALLRPGGRLYLLDVHPQLSQLSLVDGKAQIVYPWRTSAAAPLIYDETTTYTGDPRPLTHSRNYEWIHPLSDVVNALILAGLRLDFLNEHEVIVWKAFPDMPEVGEDVFALADGYPSIPLSFSVGASKPMP